MEALGGGAVSYERGTPVLGGLLQLHRQLQRPDRLRASLIRNSTSKLRYRFPVIFLSLGQFGT